MCEIEVGLEFSIVTHMQNLNLEKHKKWLTADAISDRDMILKYAVKGTHSRFIRVEVLSWNNLLISVTII